MTLCEKVSKKLGDDDDDDGDDGDDGGDDGGCDHINDFVRNLKS